MLSECNSLTSIDLNSFNTKSVKNMENIFFNCESLNSLDLNNFDTSSVNYLFSIIFGMTIIIIIFYIVS